MGIESSGTVASVGGTASAGGGWTEGRRWWVFAGALAAVVFLVYTPALKGGFLWDDLEGHVTRPELRSVSGLGRIWTQPGATQQYYPLTHTVFWVEYQAWGKWTPGYHVVNLLMHCGAAVLFGLVLRKLGVGGAMAAAAVFALHPVMVESVAWISELKNTMSAVLFLSAGLAYLYFDERRSGRLYALAVGLFVLALLSKTVTATLPGALLVVMWWKRGRLEWKRDVAPVLPMFAAGIVMGLTTASVEYRYIGAGHESFRYDYNVVERGLIAGRVAWFYLGKLLWPAELVFFYPRWDVSWKVWWQYLYPAGALAALAGCWAARRRSRAPLAAALLFGGLLFPVLGFLRVFPFRYSLVADHFQYLASLPMIALAAGGLWRVVASRGEGVRTVLYVASAALVCVLGVLSWRQAHVYADNRTLYEATLKRNPSAWVAALNLGRILDDQGKTGEALGYLFRAREVAPDEYEVRVTLADLLRKDRRYPEALEELAAAERLRANMATTRVGLGAVYSDLGEYDRAIGYYHEALGMNLREELEVTAMSGLGATLARAGRKPEAIEYLRKASERAPDNVGIHLNLGRLCVQTGRSEEGAIHLFKAVELEPNDPVPQWELAWLLATDAVVSDENGPAAKAYALNAAKLQGSRISPDRADVLAAAYAAAGEYEEAMKWAKTSLEAVKARGDAVKAGEIEARLERYRKKQPWREGAGTRPAGP